VSRPLATPSRPLATPRGVHARPSARVAHRVAANESASDACSPRGCGREGHPISCERICWCLQPTALLHATALLTRSTAIRI